MFAIDAWMSPYEKRMASRLARATYSSPLVSESDRLAASSEASASVMDMTGALKTKRTRSSPLSRTRFILRSVNESSARFNVKSSDSS